MECQKWMLLDILDPLNKPSWGANAHLMDCLMKAREYNQLHSCLMGALPQTWLLLQDCLLTLNSAQSALCLQRALPEMCQWAGCDAFQRPRQREGAGRVRSCQMREELHHDDDRVCHQGANSPVPSASSVFVTAARSRLAVCTMPIDAIVVIVSCNPGTDY